MSRTSLRLRVVPRLPSSITGGNGVKVVKTGLNYSVQPDFPSLVAVPSIASLDTTFFQALDIANGVYSRISATNLLENIQEVIVGPNLTGIAALSTGADKVPYFLDNVGNAATYTVSSYVRGVSGAANSGAYLTAIGAATAAQGAEADTAVQRGGDTMTGDLRLTNGVFRTYKNLQSIPTSPDNFGTIITHNRSAGDGETNMRNMYVNGSGATKAYTLSQIITAGSAETDLLTLYRNGQAKVGNIGWLESLAGLSETVAGFASLSRAGLGIPILGAVRTSDLAAPAYFSGQGVFGFGINDRARGADFDHTFPAWGAYFEARRTPGSGRAHGVEIGTVVIDDGTDPIAETTPYNYGQNNQMSSLLMSAGRPDVGNGQRDIDVGLLLINNGPSGHQVSFSTGIVFGANSVRYDGSTAPAIVLPTQYGLRWHTSDGLRSYIHSDQNPTTAQTIGMVIRDTYVSYEFQAVESMRMKPNALRNLNYNSGFEDNGTYVGSLTATQQWQWQTGAGLFLNINTGTTAAPVWANRGTFNATTGAYSSVSDASLKHDIEDFPRSVEDTIVGVATAVKCFKMNGDDSNTVQLGFIAQILQNVLPEAIQTDANVLMVTDRPIVAALSLAVEALLQRVKALEARQ